MKYYKIIPLIIAMALVVASPIPVLAEDSPSITNTLKERAREAREKFQAEREAVKEQGLKDRAEFKGERAEIRGEHQDKIKSILDDDSVSTSSKRDLLKDEREMRRGKVDDLKKDRIEAYASRITRRLTAAIERISSLIDRVEERLTKADAKGIDITKAQGLISEARTNLSEAKVGLADFQAKVSDLVTTSTPGESFVKAKEAAGTVITKIKTAHAKIVEAITSLKADLKDSPDDQSDDSSASN
ncbi:MAG: hypothetical protein K8Q91_03370 [Candidatus Vogelbacteria bacterium]|nr:hypothetical protein [Candidatus Vogelbacteria bacterium]